MRYSVTARRLLPGLVAFVIAAAVAMHYGVQLSDLARFTFASLWSVLLPGYLVLRWCRPQGRTLFEDVCVAFVVGLAVQLVAWALFVGAGAGSWLIVFPAVLLVIGLAVPRLRERLRVDPYVSRTPEWATWAMAVGFGYEVLVLGLGTFATTPVPPGRRRWFQDLYWHLAISAEARHSAPPQVPQVSGQELDYHWFSNAHMAADSLVGHLGVLVVTVRLWYLPVYAVTIGLTYVVTSRLSRSSKAGALSVLLLVSAASFNPVHWLSGTAVDPFIPASPSEIFGLPILLLTTWWLAQIVRGGHGRWPSWVLLVLMLVTCAGAKSSNLPVLLCGLLLVLVVGAVRRRLRRGIVAASVLTLGALVVTAPFLAGGSAASKIRLLSIATYLRDLGHTRMTSLPHLQITAVIVLITLLLLIQYSGAVLAIPLLGDPAAVLMLGMCAAGASAMLLIDHPSLSELYFMLGVLPVLDVLVAWGTARILHRARLSARNQKHLMAVGLAIALGALVTYALRRVGGSASLKHLSNHALARGWLVTIVVTVAVGAVAVLVLRDRQPAAMLRALAAMVLLGAIVVPSVGASAEVVTDGQPSTHPTKLSPEQISGTTWVRRHVAPSALIATNVHCSTLRTRPQCDSRAFWVTGLGEHQAYVSSWGYTDQAQASAAAELPPGVKRVRYSRQPFFDPQRLRLNDAAFTAPTPTVLDRLYDAGVRVLFADSGAGPVSPQLRRLAERVFTDGRVSIYRLQPPRR